MRVFRDLQQLVAETSIRYSKALWPKSLPKKIHALTFVLPLPRTRPPLLQSQFT